MKIINLSDNQNNQFHQNCCLTIGNFDGIHIGHKAILSQVINHAKINNCHSALLTFDPHPIFTLNKKITNNFLITNLKQKQKILKDCGLDYLFIINFDQEIANLSANSFIKKFLIDQLNIKHLIIGYDFIFGKNKSGDANLLRQAATKYQFNFSQVSAQVSNFKNNDQQIYSSSLIRQLINQGKIKQANKLLGHDFSISATVIKGQQQGRTIGFPTANLKLDEKIIKPKYGVYHVKAITKDGTMHNAIANFGIRPTVNNNQEILEVHIPNFKNNIYHQNLTINFIDFIRDEKKFSSLEKLQQQIKQDLTKI